VAEEWLAANGYPEDFRKRVLECISRHHPDGVEMSMEAVLRDADALDFLGVIGVLRDFSKKPRDLRAAYEQVRKRMADVPAMLHLEHARALGAKRLQRMGALLMDLEAETSDCF
jgi:hypothetical protein